MDGEAVKELAERLQGPTEIGGFVYSPKEWGAYDPISLIKPGPQAVALGVYTLGALAEYVKANRDALDLTTLVAHVVGPDVVVLNGKLQDRSRARESYVKATALNLTENFLGKFMSLEEFVIGLQSRFLDSGERTALLRLFSNVKHETVKTSSDDGIGQTVTAKAGVALVSDVVVPNPVTLSPFRTFREVLQPASSFVLRVQPGRNGGLPEAGLFEADGGAWRIVAVDRVRDWLIEALPEGVAVLA